MFRLLLFPFATPNAAKPRRYLPSIYIPRPACVAPSLHASLFNVASMPHSDPFVIAEQHLQRALATLPAPLSRFLGYRGQKLPPSPTYVICLYGFIGAFGGLGIILAIFGHSNYFTSRNVPAIVASYVGLCSPTCLAFAHVLLRVHPQFSAMVLSMYRLRNLGRSYLVTSSVPLLASSSLPSLVLTWTPMPLLVSNGSQLRFQPPSP